MNVHWHKGDLPASVKLAGDLAVDTETMGLRIGVRDRLCLVQIGDASGEIHLVQLQSEDYEKCNRLKRLLGDDKRVKIFHFARFDIAALYHYLGVEMNQIYCTKIASRLCRTYTDKHGLKELCKEELGVDISKQQQCSDWGASDITKEQQLYAATDVKYLHKLREKLDERLKREGRFDIARECFAFLPARARLDLMGWMDEDIFSHGSP